MRRVILNLAAMGLAVLLAACAPVPPEVSQNDIDLLAAEINNLGAGVSAEEAARAAQIAYTYPLQLAQEYNVTDSPIVHNIKVNNGWRERGICVHWAEDLEARLKTEGFETLVVHRAIAEGNEFRIDHSTAIISARGEAFDEGIVLDPWRFSGLLYWAPTTEDEKYFWEPRLTVLSRKADAESGAVPEGLFE
jgi:hypothetical protein